MGPDLEHGFAEAGPPIVFGSLGVDHFGRREGLDCLLPDPAAGEIHLRGVAGKDALPVVGFARGDLRPDIDLLRVGKKFHHVVAGAKSKRFQSRAGRHGAGAAHAGADNFEGHSGVLSGGCFRGR